MIGARDFQRDDESTRWRGDMLWLQMTVASTPASSNAAANLPPQNDSESASGTNTGLMMSNRITKKLRYANMGGESR